MPVDVALDMLLDEPVIAEDLQDVFCGADPDLFADVGGGDGVGFSPELDVMVGVDGGLLPLDDFEAIREEVPSGEALPLGENDVGLLARGAVTLLAVVVDAPAFCQSELSSPSEAPGLRTRTFRAA